jgi:hypothetical protein
MGTNEKFYTLLIWGLRVLAQGYMTAITFDPRYESYMTAILTPEMSLYVGYMTAILTPEWVYGGYQLFSLPQHIEWRDMSTPSLNGIVVNK